MLVLSRQRDESIMIGDDVEITIVDVRGDKVRLGITAPKHIPVHRREIYDAIQREKAEKSEEVAANPDNEPAQKTEEPAHKKSEKPEKTPQKQE
jgi:carbon storage regulator